MFVNAKAIAIKMAPNGPLEKYLTLYIRCICTQSWCNCAKEVPSILEVGD